MAKWKIVYRAATDGRAGVIPVDILTDYSNSVLREKGDLCMHRAIRICQLVSIAGKTPADLGMEPAQQKYETVSTELGEYNGSGYWFIRLREGVTLKDFDIEVAGD